MEVISSKENELIKHIRKLKDKKERELSKEFSIEGIKIVEEAIKENAKIKYIVICEECEGISDDLMNQIIKYEYKYVTKYVFESLKTVVNTQGIIAVIDNNNKENTVKYDEDIIVCLDNIQDPGNLGTIIRTVDSIGIKQIIVSKESADVYNPKVVRATMGAIFRLNIIYVEDLKEAIIKMQENKYEAVVTSLEAKKDIYEIDYLKKVIIVGNESKGVSDEIQNLADQKVIIPMLGKTESLNASVAASVIMYEYVRQKIKK